MKKGIKINFKDVYDELRSGYFKQNFKQIVKTSVQKCK